MIGQRYTRTPNGASVGQKKCELFFRTPKNEKGHQKAAFFALMDFLNSQKYAHAAHNAKLGSRVRLSTSIGCFAATPYRPSGGKPTLAAIGINNNNPNGGGDANEVI